MSARGPAGEWDADFCAVTPDEAMAVMEIPVVDPIALNRTLERLEGSDPPSGQNVQLRLSGTVYVFA